MAYIGISPFGQTVRTVTTITATTSQTTFTPTGGYTVGYCDVYYNGIKLVGGTDFTATDGLTVVLTTGATSGAVVEIITYGSVTITDAVRRSGDTFAGAVAINSTLAAGNTTITGNTTTTTLNSGNTAITGTLAAGNTTITGSTNTTTLNSGNTIVTGTANVSQGLTANTLTVSTNTATFGTAVYHIANGFVGVGTSNPIGKLTVSNGGAEGLEINPSGGTVGLTAYNRSGAAYAQLNLTGTAGIGVSLGPSYITTNSNLSVTNIIGVGGATPASNGAGITFPATQSASTDPNTLDDYEEGTWTPTYTAASGTLAGVSSSGIYTKIGRTVNIIGKVSCTGQGSASGQIAVGNFPFASQAGYGASGFYITEWYQGTLSTETFAVVRFEGSTTSCSVIGFNLNGSADLRLSASGINSGSGLYLTFCGTYTVA